MTGEPVAHVAVSAVASPWDASAGDAWEASPSVVGAAAGASYVA